MKKSILVKLMKGLSTKELEDFERYLSGRFPENKVQINLFLHLKKYLSHTEGEPLNKGYISKYVLNGATTKRIGSEASRIHKRLEDFLILQHLESKEAKQKRTELLIEVYEHKKMFDKRNTITERSLENLEKNPKKEASDYWLLSEWYQKQYTAAHKTHMHSSISTRDILVRSQENLDIFHALRSLQYTCEFLCRNQIFNEFNAVEVLPLPSSFEEIPAFKNYHLHAQLLASPDIESYYNAKNYLFSHLDNIHSLDAKRCLSYLLNVLAGFIRTNQKDYRLEVFELYKQGRAHDLLLHKKVISSIRFNNILALAAVHHEYDWANQFIEEYKPYLEKEERSTTVTLARSTLLFEQGLFEQVADVLNKRKYSNTGNEVRRRILLISSYVELNDDVEQIHHLINNFSSFIFDKKNLNPSMQAGVRNYISIVKKLLIKEVSQADVQSQLSSFEEIYMKSWLQKKVNHYKRKY